jgi:hypothetical protein
MRWMAGLTVLLLAAAACERAVVHPDAAPASMNLGDGFPGDSINGDTGYFGSGHVEPPPPQTDSIKGGGTQN